jgi:hypothetical protein
MGEFYSMFFGLSIDNVVIQIRYYTLLLLLFDVIQIHTFAIPGVTSDNVYV